MRRTSSIILGLLLANSLIFIQWRCCLTCSTPRLEVHLVSPADGAIISSPRVTLKWNIESHNLYEYGGGIRVTEQPSGIERHYSFLLTDSMVLDSLNPSTDYEWFVTVSGPAMYEDRSKYDTSMVWTFSTTAVLSDTLLVSSPIPLDGSIAVDSVVTLSWNYINSLPGPTYFDLYLGTSASPSVAAESLTVASYGPDTLAGGTLYNWKVVVYNNADTAESPVWSFTTIQDVGADIYAQLDIDVLQAPSGYHTLEELRARFDTGQSFSNPLQADSVLIEGVSLNWSAPDSAYTYTEMSMPFIENGEPVNFLVHGNSTVPSLNTDIVFPACTLAIISPETFDHVSINGFEVQWEGQECGGMVWLVLMDGTDSTGVIKEVANDGSDSLTAADLAPLSGQTGVYDLVIMKQVEENISASGYQASSLMRARVMQRMAQIQLSNP